jgi:hypothetical protein
MYQNSKKELHIIISPKNNNFVFLFYWNCQLILRRSNAMPSLSKTGNGVIHRLPHFFMKRSSSLALSWQLNKQFPDWLHLTTTQQPTFQPMTSPSK